MPTKDLKGLADDMKSQLGSGVVAVISNMGGKASLVVGVSDDLTRGAVHGGYFKQARGFLHGFRP